MAMKGVFTAGGLTFTVNACNISEVLINHELQRDINQDNQCVAMPVINIMDADLSVETLILVLIYDDREVGVLINEVLGLHDFNEFKHTTPYNNGVSKNYYYHSGLEKNIVDIGINQIFCDSKCPAIHKRVFSSNKDHSLGNSEYYLTLESNGKMIAIETKHVATTIMDFKLEQTDASSKCYVGDVLHGGKKVPCLDFGYLTGMAGPKGARNVMVIVRINGNLVGLNVDKIYDVSKIPNENVRPFPKVGQNEPWFSGIMINPDLEHLKIDHDNYVYVLSSEKLNSNPTLTSMSKFYGETTNDKGKEIKTIKTVIVSLESNARTEYYSIPTSDIADIFTSNVIPLGFPGCEIVNGITHFNNEAYTVVNTKIVLGVDTENSNENNRNFITISLDNNRFAFEVDGLIEVTETELINERPNSPKGQGRAKDDQFYCQSARASFDGKKQVINLVYMKDVLRKILRESELGINVLECSQ